MTALLQDGMVDCWNTTANVEGHLNDRNAYDMREHLMIKHEGILADGYLQDSNMPNQGGCLECETLRCLRGS